MSRSQAIVVTLLSGWALLLLVTHRGSRSPYTYIAQMSGTVTRVANPDALTVVPVTRFFYDGSRTNWAKAHNLKLPFHSFAAATAAAFVRPYLFANEVTNLVFIVLLIIAATSLAARAGLRDRAMLPALATLLALPAFVVYLGQPMHYVVGPVINYLVVMTAIALPASDLRNPWISGALTAILTLNYDWYVFGGALVVYVLAVLRFERKRDDFLYLAVSILPAVVWHAFLRLLTEGAASRVLREAFIETVLVQWADVFAEPGKHMLVPFVAAHVGLNIGLHQVLALIYWPLLAAGAIGGWNARIRGSRLVMLLVILFFVEQMVAGAFDVENNPRRAFAVVFAFAFLYCQVVDRRMRSRGWAATFLVVFGATAFLAFSDVTLGKAGTSYLQIGDAMRAEARAPLRFAGAELQFASSPDPRQAAVLRAFPAARLDLAVPFLFAQAFVGFWLMVLLALLRRAELVPRSAPAVFAAVWLISAVRFL